MEVLHLMNNRNANGPAESEAGPSSKI